MADRSDPSSPAPRSRRRWLWRGSFAVALLAILLIGLMANRLLTDRLTENARSAADVRLAQSRGNLMAELRQQRIVPQLLALDPTLIAALNSGDHTRSTQRLLSFVDEIGAADLILLDRDGRVVAATNRNRIGELLGQEPMYLNAWRDVKTRFTLDSQPNAEASSFYYSRRIMSGAERIGVIVVKLNLSRFERVWAGVHHTTAVTDSTGVVILSTKPAWRGDALDTVLTSDAPVTLWQRGLRRLAGWALPAGDVVLDGVPVMRQDTQVPHEGWRMSTFTTYAGIRSQVSTVLALVLMALAILTALALYAVLRRTARRELSAQRESAKLRQLNTQLKQEVAERKRAQENLAVAEQSLEQSSKLAALGEMSAAVSHELNQPLAAMKTYLAGARLLLRRNRPDEALSAFGRLDELIERMGAITRQLKSYARKGQDGWTPVVMQDALAGSLAMMEPQLRQRQVTITRSIPPDPLRVHGDQLRIEQVLINLIRNALDATRAVSDPRIEIILTDEDADDKVRCIIRDNGPGIVDKDALFEPFYTTKQPGDGVGLGLAISSGIVNELGGRLTARNSQGGGAVFEMQLPALDDTGHPGSGQRAAE